MSETEQYDNILTPEQCLQLVEKKLETKDFKLLNYTIKPISADTKGYLGSHLIGNFEVLHNGKSETVKFFFKLKFDNDCDKSASKLCTPDNDVYKRESEFLKLVTTIYHVDWAPQFYALFNGNLLVLEDLTQRGYKLAEVDEYDLDHCKVGLKALANYHAFSYKYFHDKTQSNPDYSVLKECPFFFKEVLFQSETDLGKKWMESTKNSMLFMLDQMPEKTISKDKIKKIFIEKFDRLCENLLPVENRYNIMSHGDLWGNNIMFTYENNLPTKCCLIDFQLLRYLPPAMDVQFFLAVNTSPSFRRQNSRMLLDYYYERLMNGLSSVFLEVKDVYPKKVFASTCKDTIITALLIACCYKTFLLINREKMNTYMKDKVMSEEIMYGDRAKYVKIELEADEAYKKKVFEEYQALIDAIIC